MSKPNYSILTISDYEGPEENKNEAFNIFIEPAEREYFILFENVYVFEDEYNAEDESIPINYGITFISKNKMPIEKNDEMVNEATDIFNDILETALKVILDEHKDEK